GPNRSTASLFKSLRLFIHVHVLKTWLDSRSCNAHCASSPRFPHLHCQEFTGILAGMDDGTTATEGALRPSRCAERTNSRQLNCSRYWVGVKPSFSLNRKRMCRTLPK